MKTILSMALAWMVTVQTCYGQVRAVEAGSAEALERIANQRQNQIEARRAGEKKATEDHNKQIADAKKRFWDAESPQSDKANGELPNITGVWWNGVEGEGRQEMTVVQKGKEFTATCGYRHPQNGEIRWRLTGTVSKDGQYHRSTDPYESTQRVSEPSSHRCRFTGR